MKRKLIIEKTDSEQPLKKQKIENRTFLTDDKKSWIDLFQLPKELMISKEEMNELWEMHPKEFKTVHVFNNEHNTPRWFQSYGQSYKFSGHEYEALPIPPIIQKYLDYANSLPQYSGTENAKFNMCLANWYADGTHYIGYHSDDEKQIIKNKDNECEVFSISFGHTRCFRLQPKDKTKSNTRDFQLTNGTVVVMGGQTQKSHKHSITKISGEKAKTVGKRINLTFRKFQVNK